ncbi:MAG: hypothetical protein EXQ48_04900 [Acidobacteria bacterium]|nr:hypothetical protein [Acidobacteriota bacterium]
MIGVTDYLDKRIDYGKCRDFDSVSVERNLEGEAIEAGAERGWAFYELKNIDPAQGGATRAEVDALRLMAVFLHHWDNKTANQRLICPDSKTADCKHPLAMIQDVGSDFGPKKSRPFRMEIEAGLGRSSQLHADDERDAVRRRHVR